MELEPQIVVGVDASPSSRAALEWAAHRAQRHDLVLRLVHAVPDYLVSPGKIEYQGVHDALGGLLSSEAGRAREFAPTLKIQTSLHFGEPAQVLAELSASSVMVVVGTDRTADVHGEGFGALNLQLATIGRCPVAVIPARQSAENTGIVVGIDGSPQAMAAAYFAASEAESSEQELTVIYASSAAAGRPHGSGRGPALAQPDDIQGRMIMETAVTCLRARHIHLTVCERFVHDNVPARALIQAGTGAAMLVVGTRGRGATQHALMGQVTHGILLQTPCPVVLTQQDYGHDAAGQDSNHHTVFHPLTPVQASTGGV